MLTACLLLLQDEGMMTLPYEAFVNHCLLDHQPYTLNTLLLTLNTLYDTKLLSGGALEAPGEGMCH